MQGRRKQVGMETGRWVWIAFATTWLSVGLGGCAQEVRTNVPEEPPPIEDRVTRDTPEATSDSLLRLLRAHLDAVARHDREAATSALGQAVWHVAARDEIVARQRMQPVSRPIAELEVLQRCVESWAAMISYYDEFEIDAARVLGRANAPEQLVRLPCHAPDDDAELELTCVRRDDNTWRVRALTFAPQAAALAAAESRPTTQPGD